MDDRVAANRANWQERTDVHLRSRFYDVEGWLAAPHGPRPWEVEALGDLAGRRLVHLQCHLGLDTLAWAVAGAEVTGLDFAPAAIDAARRIARRAGLAERARFVCADVHEATAALDHATFDVVYVSLGALCWLPSVDRWAAQAAALVRPGGRLYLHDSHPLSWAMAEDSPVVEHSYFEQDEPYVDDRGRTYADSDAQIASRRTYEWNHSLGETVSALLRHGLVLERFDEHDWTVWPRFPWLVPDDTGRWRAPPGSVRLPLSFTVVARRPGGP